MNHYHVERSLHLHVHNSSDHDVANKRLTCSLGHVPGTVVDALRVLTARVLETALCRGRGAFSTHTPGGSQDTDPGLSAQRVDRTLPLVPPGPVGVPGHRGILLSRVLQPCAGRDEESQQP